MFILHTCTKIQRYKDTKVQSSELSDIPACFEDITAVNCQFSIFRLQNNWIVMIDIKYTRLSANSLEVFSVPPKFLPHTRCRRCQVPPVTSSQSPAPPGTP